MSEFLNENCESGKILMDFYLCEQLNKSDTDDYPADCTDYQDVSGESLRLKKLLKRAVDRDFAPPSLTDSIKKQIRR